MHVQMSPCMQMDVDIRTPSEVKEWLNRHGVTATEWARAHGFKASVVFALLNGRTRGNHGMAHRAAVALGLKPPVDACEPSPLSATLPHVAGHGQTEFSDRMKGNQHM